ncbi:hypothetical protein [Actinocorallia sp. A-T 12471]|uniref:hypothetical protein n=1 Tax=Actinocorallia sp. A-T 12471 TaxID=3089813 RepID=UPI0029D09D09|nr:hypothetical protein [Actinocorallia sp. A-T 12471]MDX6743483.1 hypothetical protein [Actinocorallia sp. A-T 12471]
MGEARLGVDLGRVVVGANRNADGRVFLDDPRRMPLIEGAFEVLPRIVERFNGQAWVISRISEEGEPLSLAWLEHYDFYGVTGIARSRIRYCRLREEKALHCAELGITHMIDDRLDVHRAIRDVVPNRYLFGPQDEPPPDWVVPTLTWRDLDEAIGYP